METKTTTHTSLIQRRAIQALTTMLQAKGIKASTMEDVMDNLHFLCNEKTQFGDEVIRWLPLNTKKLVATALDPDYRMEYVVNERTAKTLSMTANLYWSDSTYPAGTGFVNRSIETMVKGSADFSSVEQEFEALVRGAAATRALTDAGIGMEFYSDNFDALFASIEEADATERKNRTKTPTPVKVPDVPVKKRKQTVTEARKETVAEAPEVKEVAEAPEVKETVEAPVVKEPTAPINAEPVKEATPVVAESISEPVAANKPNMTIDEAKMVVAGQGNRAGEPLGIIMEEKPAFLRWLANSNDVSREAARVLIFGCEELAALRSQVK